MGQKQDDLESINGSENNGEEIVKAIKKARP
jgi:hypothetical protein